MEKKNNILESKYRMSISRKEYRKEITKRIRRNMDFTKIIADRNDENGRIRVSVKE